MMAKGLAYRIFRIGILIYNVYEVLIGLIRYGNPDTVPLKCEQDTCASTAKCVNTGSYVYCECPHGKTGANCTLDDPCLPQTENCPEGKYCAGPCDPNVICEGATGEPRCRGCIAGWTGMACDIDMDECFHVPYICSNGGTCINVIGDFTCACTSEWTGKECRCKKGTACEKEIEQSPQQTTPANGKPRFSSNFSTCILAILFYCLLNT